MYSFEVVNNSQLYFFHKLLLAPSKCLFKWIKVSNSDAKGSICNWVGLQAVFAD